MCSMYLDISRFYVFSDSKFLLHNWDTRVATYPSFLYCCKKEQAEELELFFWSPETLANALIKGKSLWYGPQDTGHRPLFLRGFCCIVHFHIKSIRIHIAKTEGVKSLPFPWNLMESTTRLTPRSLASDQICCSAEKHRNTWQRIDRQLGDLQ